MSIRFEERYGRAGYDIRFPKLKIRERSCFPREVRTEAARRKYAEARARDLLANGKPERVTAAPTFKDFAPRWRKDHAIAEGLKPSTLDAYDRILRLHLVPVVGETRLDAIGELQVQRVKLHVARKSDKTRACVLSLLAEMLAAAERWDLIGRAPRIELPSFMPPEMAFHDFDAWEHLVEGARRAGPMHLAMVLLGGEAGLRRGELVALEQGDITPAGIVVQRSEWKGRVGKPKGGKSRRVPMTPRLKEAIAAIRHLRGKRLLWKRGGAVKFTTLQSWLETACRRAGMAPSRNLHKLRHTFCSHLAMRGATPKAIQELAGHADLKTTQRYMHLSPAHLEAAIALLGAPSDASLRGDYAGTATSRPVR